VSDKCQHTGNDREASTPNQPPASIVRDDDVCRRLMTVPGVGPVVALTYHVTVDVPARFRNSKAVGAVFGLTPAKYQSGENDRTGAISRCGDEMMRMMLYEAAQSMLVRAAKWSWLKAWAQLLDHLHGARDIRLAASGDVAVKKSGDRLHAVALDPLQHGGEAGARIDRISAAHGRVVELADQLVAGAAATISFLSKIRSYAQKY
jgi:transposase IS116/IS110/IS902 family protein